MQQPAKNRECKEKIRIDLPQQTDKMVLVGMCPGYLSLRTSAHAGVAIPPLRGTR